MTVRAGQRRRGAAGRRPAHLARPGQRPDHGRRHRRRARREGPRRQGRLRARTLAAYDGQARPRSTPRTRREIEHDPGRAAQAGHQPRRVRLLRRPLRHHVRRLDHPELRHLRRAVRQASCPTSSRRSRQTGVQAVFSESSLPPKTAETIGRRGRRAGRRRARTRCTATRLGPAGSAGATYLEVERHNTDTHREGAEAAVSSRPRRRCALRPRQPSRTAGARVVEDVARHRRTGRGRRPDRPQRRRQVHPAQGVLGLVDRRRGPDRGARRHAGRRPAARSRTCRRPTRSTPQFPVSVGQVVLMGRYRTSAGCAGRAPRTGRSPTQALDAVGLADRAQATGSARCPAASGSGCCWPGRSPQQPRLLLLDEPFNGVDAVSQQALLRRVAALQARRRRGRRLHPRPRPRPPRLRRGLPAQPAPGRVRARPARRSTADRAAAPTYGGQRARAAAATACIVDPRLTRVPEPV